MIAVAAAAAEGLAELVGVLDELGPVLVLGPERPSDLPAHAAFVTTDLSSAAGTREAWAAGEAARGPVEALITVPSPLPAGPTPTTQVGDELWSDTLRDNLTVAMHAVRAAVPAMLDRGHGRIVMATWRLDRAAGMAPFAAVGGAVRLFARALASEVGDRGVTVNAVSALPGRLADMAPAVRLLCSPDAGYLTAEVLSRAVDT